MISDELKSILCTYKKSDVTFYDTYDRNLRASVIKNVMITDDYADHGMAGLPDKYLWNKYMKDHNPIPDRAVLVSYLNRNALAVYNLTSICKELKKTADEMISASDVDEWVANLDKDKSYDIYNVEIHE